MSNLIWKILKKMLQIRKFEAFEQMHVKLRPVKLLEIAKFKLKIIQKMGDDDLNSIFLLIEHAFVHKVH